MRGKRPTTEEKIRMLREVAGGRSIREVCQERNLSEATFQRWRKRLGLMEMSALRRRGRAQRLSRAG
jgi:transposase